jgi:hypothetical protein
MFGFLFIASFDFYRKRHQKSWLTKVGCEKMRLELYELAWSEWDMSHLVSTILYPISLVKIRMKFMIIAQIKKLVFCHIRVTDFFKRSAKEVLYLDVSYCGSWNNSFHVLIQCSCSDQVDSLDNNIQHILQIRKKSLQCQSMSKNTVTRDQIWIHLFDESHESWIFL